MPPTAGAVVDAFKNLIRHGKHHHHERNDHRQGEDGIISPNAPIGFYQQQHPQEQAKDRQQAAPERVVSPSSREVVEMIVNQEREEKAKIPVYLGLDDFKIVEKMGEGAFSNVYSAINKRTNKHAAVKVVRKYELNHAQAQNKHLNHNFKIKPRVTERANILKEVQIMRGINHSSIVKLLSFSESPEHYFLVLELMDGGELFHQIVKLTYFSENLSRHVILQVADGIRYLHEERGVVHRDIKPENLLFQRIPIIPSKFPQRRQYDEDKEDEGEFIPGVGGGGIGRVRIADFGLSKVVWNEQTMTPCGTVGYTAPEIVKDERYSKSVDMWALGCVLYTLLCGFPPFYDESIQLLTEKVAKGEYTFLSPWWNDIGYSPKDLIQHLLCVDPSKRFGIDEFIQHPWCNEAPAPPPPPTPLVENTMDSPLLTAIKGGRAEGKSPGLATLRGAFDITYAVHRMNEEAAHRRKHGGNAGAQRFLSELNEDDEDEEAEEDEEPRGRMALPAVHPQNDEAAAGRVGHGSVRTRKIAGGTTDHGHGKGFELDIHRATLLGRRHKRANRGPLGEVETPLALAASGMRIADEP